uniref:P-type domain-containing protein n=1 Tax=Dicentrarchus labrax TaxID=13489 RepID=A0A8C4F680_DICLA
MGVLSNFTVALLLLAFALSTLHPESSQKTDISRDIKCTMAPESRFDCAMDRLLSQGECEQRGCCYVPLPKSAGPPWCFYPSLYPGY